MRTPHTRCNSPLLYSNYQNVHELRQTEIRRADSPVDRVYGVNTWYLTNNIDNSDYFPC